MREIVKLRSKTSKANGTQSLFLEWRDNGIRKFEFLKLYILPGKDARTKAQNKQTMECAKTIQAKKILEIQQVLTGSRRNKDQAFLDYLDQYVASHCKEGSSYYKGMMSARKLWKERFAIHKGIQSIDRSDMMQFSRHLKTSLLSESSAYAYYNKISTVLSSAVKDGLIDRNPAKSLDRSEKPSNIESEREYLTIEELKMLNATPCPNEDLKKAFLFSCYTGLRYIDIEQLKWEQIDGDTLTKRIEKTEDMTYLPLSEMAKALLPKKSDSDKVFYLKSYRQMRRDLDSWIKNSGVKKKITFHCARHTFATMSLTYGTDLYTVSSLLGHKSISTTTRYAKIVDQKKVQAVNALPKI